MDNNRAHLINSGSTQTTTSVGLNNLRIADMNNWQPQRQSSANYQQQFSDASQQSQPQYQPHIPHYTHQSPSNNNVHGVNSYSLGSVRYYQAPPMPPSKLSMSPMQLGKSSTASANSLNQAHLSSASHPNNSINTNTYQMPPSFDFRTGGFSSAAVSDGSASDNQISSQEEGVTGSGNAQTSHLNLGTSPLRRGQACQACRRRKLKCDAIRPVCGTCTRSRKAAASANHAPPIPDGDCVYDDVSPTFHPTQYSQPMQGIGQAVHSTSSKARRASNVVSGHIYEDAKVNQTSQKRRKTIDDVQHRSSLAWDRAETSTSHSDQSVDALPGETVKQRTQRLENRIRELEGKLKEKEDNQNMHNNTDSQEEEDAYDRKHRELYTNGPVVPIFSMLSPSSGKEERYRLQYSQRPARQSTGSSLKNETTSFVAPESKPSLFDFPGMNRDEQIRNELASGHFAGDDPILQLLWPGWSCDLPSPDTVLTICETFFRLHPMRSLVYKPSFLSGLTLPPKHPHRPHDSLIHAILATTADMSPFFSTKTKDTQERFVMLLADSRSRSNLQGSNLAAEQLSFKEFHLRKAREKVEYSLITEFRNPLDWISACVLACFTLWNDYRITESYFLSAILSRGVSPAGLDKLPSRHFSGDAEVNRAPGLFGSPQGVEEHERRMTFWHIFITDQYNGGAPQFYENLVSEASILTHLPCAVADFQAGKDVAPNRQTLTSPDLFRTGHIDDFTLHIKSAILIRRACTLHCRNQLTKKKPTGLTAIDKHITEFLDSFPTFDFDDRDQISVDKLTAWTNIFLALFHLHEPYLTPTSLSLKENNPQSNYSSKRINLAVDKVLGTIHYLMNSSFDFALLHPQVFLTWSVCARMLGKEMDWLKRAGTGSESAIQQVMEKLHWIVMALERAGEKNVKARRCSELVSYVKSGTLHESILNQLLYTDGVIPTGDDDTPMSVPSGMTSDTSLEALMMSATSAVSNDATDSQSSPEIHSMLPPGYSLSGSSTTEANDSSHQSMHQVIPEGDMLLNFAM